MRKGTTAALRASDTDYEKCVGGCTGNSITLNTGRAMGGKDCNGHGDALNTD